jgi:hypothetical protein
MAHEKPNGSAKLLNRAAKPNHSVELRNETAKAECESQLSRILSLSHRLMRLRIEIERQNNIHPF